MKTSRESGLTRRKLLFTAGRARVDAVPPAASQPCGPNPAASVPVAHPRPRVASTRRCCSTRGRSR